MMKLFYSTVSASDRFRNVLSHGDLWTSNILLKFDNDKAVDCSFVDYQLLRYCPPGHDFLSVVHLTTVRDIRLNHEDALKRVYYDELSRKLFNYRQYIEQELAIEFKICTTIVNLCPNKLTCVLWRVSLMALIMCSPISTLQWAWSDLGVGKPETQ